jgi:hypothetical protein
MGLPRMRMDLSAHVIHYKQYQSELFMTKRPTWTMTWNDGMSVGIPEIDEEHKQFIRL